MVFVPLAPEQNDCTTSSVLQLQRCFPNNDSNSEVHQRRQGTILIHPDQRIDAQRNTDIVRSESICSHWYVIVRPHVVSRVLDQELFRVFLRRGHFFGYISVSRLQHACKPCIPSFLAV